MDQASRSSLRHVHDRVNISQPRRNNKSQARICLVITLRPPTKPPRATMVIRVPQLDTSTQFEKDSTRVARADLQFQSHQEHIQPLPPFLMPQLDVNSKPRIPPQVHPARPSSARISVTSSDRPAKKAVDPLDDPRYLAAEIDILCDSVKAPRLFSAHDIAEAYCALSMKARYGIATTKDISQVDRIFAALEHVKAQATIVCAAMQRDIRLAFVDPFLEVQPRNVSSVASGSLPPSNTPSGASFVERKLTVHEEKRGKDRSLLCIRALQFLSVVFRAGPFQRIFSCTFTFTLFGSRPIADPTPLQTADQLLLLLGDTLRIAFATKLPALSAYKIRLLCFWTLQSQSLPQEVLAPKASEILRSLMKCVEKSSDANFKVECLKVSIESRAHISEFFTRSHTRPLQSLLINTQSVSFRYSRNFFPQFCNISSTTTPRTFGIPPPKFFAPWLKPQSTATSQPLSVDLSQRRSWHLSTQIPREPRRPRISPP